MGVCGDTAEEEFSYNTYFKMSLNLQIQYGTSEVGWTLLSTHPAQPCSNLEGKQQSRTQPKPLLNGKEAIYRHIFAPTELLSA